MKKVEVKNLWFSYDKETILQNINFTISSKEFLTIIGPNGGGKSTLLKLLLGLLKPTKGCVKIFGKKPSEISLKLGYVPQDTNINKNFPIKVLDVVLQGRLGISKNFWGYSKKDYEIAYKSMQKVGILKLKDKKISQLSGGERQRVFIARALATEADMLLLDEPTASIDSKGQIEIFSMLKEINKSKGIIVVSHDLNVSLGFSNKVAYVNKTLVMHDSPATDKDKILQSIASKEGHICPIELIVDEKLCLHSRETGSR